jgi:hypothetical protein
MATQDDLLRALRALHAKGYKVVSAATVAQQLWPSGRTHNSNGQVFHLSAGIAGRMLRKCRAVVETTPRQWTILEERV